MNTPDKIYVDRFVLGRPLDWSFIPEEDSGNIEYIRKDALLEWAKERLNANMNKAKSRGCLHTIAANEDKELIQKLNSI